uniref:Uncharacterized protein AlNc14C111G6410 n=1 Tax=Albugo laibachii Nc14 TaxID=890382 RepID=F0WIL0_9STRA|nr:conserved hypothetical protein [Albugo laibachii Nc14]|eukprot:CCA21094.1 conserved hypothetical protein [Albugo laibachii Nc14]
MNSSELLFAFVILSDILFSGIIFGWGSLLLILSEERQYTTLCSDFLDADKVCQAQEIQLNLIFALATAAMNAVALPTGLLLDRFRPTMLITCAAAMEISGLFLFAFADSETFDVFVPAYVFLAIGGCMTMMTSFPASVVAKHHRAAALAAISCSFDASSAVFLLGYAIHENFGVTRQKLFLFHAILGIFIYGSLIILWRMNEDKVYKKLPSSKVLVTGNKTSVEGLMDESVYSRLSNEDTKRLTERSYPQYGSVNKQAVMICQSENQNRESCAGEKDRVLNSDLLDMTMKDQLCTFEFVYVLTLASLQILRTTLFIGTANKLLENYGDAKQGNLYTKAFGFVLPLGFVFVPLIDCIVKREGLVYALTFTNTLGLLYNLLSFAPILPLQIVTFLLFAAYRAFLYAIVSTFVIRTFGLSNLGSMMGIIFSIGSIASFLEYPALAISNSYLGGDLTVVNGFSLLIAIPLYPLTQLYKRRSQPCLLEED